jgi:hypothetical protein
MVQNRGHCYVNWLTWSIILQKKRRNREVGAAENTW